MATVSTQEFSTESVGGQQLDLSRFDSCILYYLIFGSCFGGFLIIIGLAGNGMTIAIMGRERKKSATINCLFMLAIADSLVLITYGFMLIPVGIRKYFFGWWNGHNYNHIALRYGSELTRTFSQVSAFITMLVTFQRYILYATVATGLVTYVIPVSSLSFMSIQILRTLKTQSKVMQKSDDRTQARKDLTLSSVAIVALFLICQSFVLIKSVLMWLYDPYSDSSRCEGELQYFSFVPYITMIANSSANFAIYVILAKGFRKKVTRLLKGRNQVAPNKSTNTKNT
ncbi:hypothetical protein CAPTEDRAFT_207729 [Capitella teleta]|uniref:G-protein coupled receptors family 1 profile domain-containing protein n=1 Tax=Capitella teleta TaxID=283909 RepID=R7TBW0_CAPTE|nr:hypothetical protein CAPTEDRAFT_207729 [Capitella teleta]|eukprot:ELT91199.1 hypothetical protein CAPTEDRAFT_207729 [Capitella teleta]